MESVNKTIRVDTDKAWQKLHARLSEDGLIPGEKHTRKSGVLPVWVKWAASFLLLIAAGTVFFLGLLRQPATEMLALNNPASDQTLVKFLSDGSVVYLASNSSIEYPEAFAAAERRIRMHGQAFFEVEHNPAQPFRVELDWATIEVLGTSFNLKQLADGHFELMVEEGLVQVHLRKPANEKVLVEAGQMLKYGPGGYEKTSGDYLELSLWRQNRMHFKDETLDNVLAIINRNYQAKLLAADHTVASRQITVTFFNNALPTIVELISLSMNLEAQMQPDSSIVFAAR